MIETYFSHFRDFISQPWPWYVAGPMLALVMLLLLYFGHEFGISENFRIMCAADGATDDFFKIDWKNNGLWNLLVALGAVFGGFLAAHYFSGQGNLAHVSDATIQTLNNAGIHVKQGEVPLVPEFISWKGLMSWQGLLMIAGGGLMVGFGSRYAGGCTSGHAISGLSALQVPSLVAVIGFFMGGLFITYLVIPYLFN